MYGTERMFENCVRVSVYGRVWRALPVAAGRSGGELLEMSIRITFFRAKI
jgi:hypothetical protein